MKKSSKQLLVQCGILVLLLILPMAGLYFSGRFSSEYLEFPPQAHYVEHAAFSWPVFIGLAVFIVAVCLPFFLKVPQTLTLRSSQGWRCASHCFLSVIIKKSQTGSRVRHKANPKGLNAVSMSTVLNKPVTDHRPWPLWGTAGIIFGIAAWILAWNRFAWFADFQIFTFTPLWVAYIVVVNAWTQKRTGKCMMINKPKLFEILFLLSAFFWWFFEYLNRFVQNWYYEGIGELSPFMYFLYATLPFATVLPAVLGTYDLLHSFPRLYAGTDNFIPLKINTKPIAWPVLISCLTGLALIGIYPNYLFPLLWISPMGIITSIMILQGRMPLANLADGNWKRIYLLALSALICGFFWEMWNFHSLAKWVYEVPFVNRFKIFEMPILGYSGYLPFGLECAVIVEMFKKNIRQD